MPALKLLVVEENGRCQKSVSAPSRCRSTCLGTAKRVSTVLGRSAECTRASLRYPRPYYHLSSIVLFTEI